MTALEVLADIRVLPVVEIDDAADAVPLAQALLAGGLGAVEITLRTPAGLAAIDSIVRDVPEMTVGAGTVLDAGGAARAVAVGAAFLVSPGFSVSVSAESHRLSTPLIPGAVTATEVMAAVEAGHRTLKFFPAAASGGLPALRALAAPFAHTGVRFMPTGGIRVETLGDYLAEPSVTAVGGTWIASRTDIAAARWDAIEASAREAMRVVRAINDQKESDA